MVNERLKIGVVGFSSRKFDQKEARKLLHENISSFMEGSQVSKDKIEIVSGLTNMGVPKIAYEIAVELGLRTIGISAKKALTVGCGVFPVDEQIIVGDKFGDESEAFIEYIDCLIRIGGGEQSRKEVQMFKEKCSKNSQETEGLLIEKEVEWYGS
jgi:hypothetical protein